MKELAEARLDKLQRLHRSLDDEVRKLERRAFLTPNEQRQMSELKKQKLATKDEIFAIKRDA
jgi:uncharacterized protein YdcH (DUF465 family)